MFQNNYFLKKRFTEYKFLVKLIPTSAYEHILKMLTHSLFVQNTNKIIPI